MNSAPLAVVGKSVPRKDALEKVTGQASYGVDVVLPGQLWGKILRSIHPHALVLSVDTQRAERLPGVKAVITARDAPRLERKLKTFWPENRILAREKVRFVGEEVAAVAATNEDIAGEALELIKVEYQPLRAILEPEEAMKPGAPRLHEPEGNLAASFDIVRGDPDDAFQRADHIFEDKYTTQIQHQCYLEPVSCLASFDSTGKLILWVASMDPSGIRESLAEALNLAESKIRVIQAYVGGAFGGKISLQPLYPISALLARKSGRPVKIVLNREEEFTATLPRMPAEMTIKTAATGDGTLVAKETKIIADNGAYIDRGPRILAQMIIGPDSLYRIPNIRAQARLYYTNKTPVGAFRGFGTTQMGFALESHLDRIAKELGLDPLELRLKNATQAGDITVHGWRMGSCALTRCLEEVTKKVGWKSKGPHGLACGLYNVESRRSQGFNGSVALVKLLEDGRALVISGESEYGQGWMTVAAQIAAEELGLDYQDVYVLAPDTDVTPYSLGPWALRVTVSGGNAVRLAAQDARKQLLKLAAELLEVAPEDLEFQGGKTWVKGSPDKALALAEVARAAIFRRGGSAIVGQGVDEPEMTVRPDPRVLYGNLSRAYNFSAQAVDIQLDEETGQLKVKKVYSAHDLGKAIHPISCEGQVEGGISQGIGYALMEEVLLEQGWPLNPDFLNYRVPTAADMAAIETIIIEEPDPHTPYGAKSIGMLGTIPCAPALANALHRAAGVTVKSLPLTPEKVLKELEASRRPS